jgi:ubiquinone/menaquinone biosynthesis C-methylase UbiE
MKRILEPEAMDTAEEADGYDRMDHMQANESFVGRLLELGAQGRMLDLGTGPAHIPILICGQRPEARIVAIDLAHHMLRIAAVNVERSGYGERIELRYGDAKDLDLEGRSFDVVYSNTILHHIPDPRPFLAEAARLVKPGGVLLIRDLFRPRDRAQLEALVRLHAEGADEYQRALFGASLNAAFTPDELRALADESGLARAELVVDTDRHMSLQLRAS